MNIENGYLRGKGFPENPCRKIGERGTKIILT
jgi:hypothetical protein